MHPLRPRIRVVVARFLRPRGDAPRLATLGLQRSQVPPPTRRCTSQKHQSMSRSKGSSAHAEMHLSRTRSPALRPRFLRPRGDAPSGDALERSTSGVPPPTRRCTDGRGPSRRVRAGSSAHAEMHLYDRRSWTSSRRFLRPRGDAPDSLIIALHYHWVPPPTRRCTRFLGVSLQ